MVVKVKLYGKTIGILEEINGTYYFQYDKTFIGSGIEVSPLHMPLSHVRYSFPELNFRPFFGLPGLLCDSLPDKYGGELIENWLAGQGRDIKSFTSAEKLCYIGKRGMGALEFEPSASKVRDTATNVQIEKLVELANDVVNKRVKECDVTTVNALIKVGTSAGGARAKAIVAYNAKENRFKTGQVDAGEGYEYYLIKFDGIENNKDKDKADSIYSTRIEYSYYLMCLDCGINMTETRLLEENGNYHFLTKRFDRYVENGKMKKIHMQSLCAIDHAAFHIKQSYSYERCYQTMKRLGLGQDEIEQFFTRMVFNVMAKNQDDHVKNFSFLMDRNGKWSLSPAYDMSYSFDPTGKWTNEHQMLANGKGKDITYEDILECGKKMDLKTSKINSIINKVYNVVSNYSSYAKKANLPDMAVKELMNNFNLIEAKQ